MIRFWTSSPDRPPSRNRSVSRGDGTNGGFAVIRSKHSPRKASKRSPITTSRLVAPEIWALKRVQQAARGQRFRTDHFTFRKGVQHFDVQHGVLPRKRIVESALGNAPVQGHLAAFKTRTAREALAGLLSLVAGAGGLAELRAHAASHPHFAVARAARGTKIG